MTTPSQSRNSWKSVLTRLLYPLKLQIIENCPAPFKTMTPSHSEKWPNSVLSALAHSPKWEILENHSAPFKTMTPSKLETIKIISNRTTIPSQHGNWPKLSPCKDSTPTVKALAPKKWRCKGLPSVTDKQPFPDHLSCKTIISTWGCFSKETWTMNTYTCLPQCHYWWIVFSRPSYK